MSSPRKVLNPPLIIIMNNTMKATSAYKKKVTLRNLLILELLFATSIRISELRSFKVKHSWILLIIIYFLDRNEGTSLSDKSAPSCIFATNNGELCPN